MAETITTILSSVGTFITSAIGWIGDFSEVITTNALMFVFVVAVPLSGLGIGLLNRLIKAN